jgi:hypothetical protein
LAEPGQNDTAALPPIRRIVPETYGFAPDYAWLQGTLTRAPTGFYLLRFSAGESADRSAGAVMLDADPRLAGFRDGDIVLVQGEIETGLGGQESGVSYPVYRCRDIWLVKRTAVGG